MYYDTGRIPALVLAGGINSIELFDGYRPGYKALLPICGKPLIHYTLSALTATPNVTRICIAGPVREMRNSISDLGRYEYVPSGSSLVQTIRNGLKHFLDVPAVLVIPSDLPLVTPSVIVDFLNRCAGIEIGRDPGILWSMVPEEDFSGAYREEKKKGINRFRDISVCHGNLLLMTPALLNNPKFILRMERIYNARKSSIRAALAIGPLVGMSYLVGVHLFRIFSISRFAAIASAGFGVRLVPVIMHDPGIAVDIDEPRDYRFVRSEFERRKNRTGGNARRRGRQADDSRRNEKEQAVARRRCRRGRQ